MNILFGGEQEADVFEANSLRWYGLSLTRYGSNAPALPSGRGFQGFQYEPGVGYKLWGGTELQTPKFSDEQEMDAPASSCKVSSSASSDEERTMPPTDMRVTDAVVYVSAPSLCHVNTHSCYADTKWIGGCYLSLDSYPRFRW